jgi:hypothetical protein
MAESLNSWIDQVQVKRRTQEELKDVLIEYFDSGMDEDDELSRVTGLSLEEVRRLREAYEA